MIRHGRSVLVNILATLSVLLPGAVLADAYDQATEVCKNKINSVYAVSKFRNVHAEQLGNHKFQVYGKVRRNDRGYPFNCKVKNGSVASYHYDGPHGHGSKKDNDDLGTALAVGAGLAIIAAVAASQSKSGNSSAGTSTTTVGKTVLEDNCHDMLQYRIRDEHHYTAEVRMKSSRVEGNTLVGTAKASYAGEQPHQVEYTCYVDSQGRVMDTRYHLY